MPTLERFSPFHELDLLDRRMRRMFSDFPFVPALTPAADVYETDGELVVELEVPGYEEKELDIEVSDHTLGRQGRAGGGGSEDREGAAPARAARVDVHAAVSSCLP